MPIKVNNTQTSINAFGLKMDDLRDVVESQFKLEFGKSLGFWGMEYSGRQGQLLDGGFLILKGDPKKAPLDVGASIAITQWVDSVAQSVGFGGTYRLNFISYPDTGLIVFRVYDR